MKNLIKIFVFAIFLSVVAAPVIFADECPMMHRCKMMDMHEKMWSKMELDDIFFLKAHFIAMNADEIGLSDEQLEKIMALKLNVKKSLIKAKADIETYALDIKNELTKDEINVNSLNGLIDKKYALKTQKAKDLIKAYADLKKLLTDEQKKMLKDIWMGAMKGKVKCPMMKDKDEAQEMPMMQEEETQ